MKNLEGEKGGKDVRKFVNNDAGDNNRISVSCDLRREYSVYNHFTYLVDDSYGKFSWYRSSISNWI